jgi:hypothetical protein
MGVGGFASQYQYDDGVSEGGLLGGGGGGVPLPVTYLTHYIVTSGAETVTSIDLAWGSRSAGGTIPSGMLAVVLLMSDPNQDGDPVDSLIVRQINTLTTNVGTDTFIHYDIAPVTMAPGTSFFVGAELTDPPYTSLMGIDREATGRSGDNWYMLAQEPGTGAAYTPLTVFNANWTFMNRANAVPEPASVFAIAGGLAVLIRRKRHRA